MNKKRVIIPILIIFILFINTLLASIIKGFNSFAVDVGEESKINIEYNKDDPNNIIIFIGANFDKNIKSIKYAKEVYISKDEVMDYFNNSNNNILDLTNENKGISKNVLALTIENATPDKYSTILVTFEDGTAHIIYPKPGKVEEHKLPNITIAYKTSDESHSVIQIEATSESSNIVLVKIAKSSEIAQNSDFESKGEELTIQPSKSVNTTYNVQEEGTYKVYVKDEEGNVAVGESKYVPIASNKTINIYHKKDNINNLVIKAQDSLHKIIKMKVIASKNNESLETVKQSGTDLRITNGKNVEAEYNVIDDSTYISVYIEDEYGLGKVVSKTINSTEELSVIVVPVEPDKDEGDGEIKPVPTPTDPQIPEETTPENKPQEPAQTPDIDNSKNEEVTDKDNNQTQKPVETLPGNEENNKEPSTGNQGNTQNGSQGTNQSSSNNNSSNNNVNSDSNSNNNINSNSNNNKNNDLSSNTNNSTNKNISNTTQTNNVNTNNSEISTENKTNIQSQTTNSSNTNNESLPKTGVEDVGIILSIIMLIIIGSISLIKFIKIK